MNRRSFMAALGLAPVAVTLPIAKPVFAGGEVVAAGKPGGFGPILPSPKGLRLSSDKTDPGYRAWCMLNGDRRKAVVYLDGVEQKDAEMADEVQGLVRRAVRTPEGNLAVSHDEILLETVKGHVRIEIV